MDDHEWLEYIRDVKKLSQKIYQTKHQEVKIVVRAEFDRMIELPSKKIVIESNLDRNLKRKILGKNFYFDAKLDLHGMNLNFAYEELKKFLLNSYNLGYSRLLVITGKALNNDNSLRLCIKDWIQNCEQMSLIVRVITEAAKCHGGAGAYYLILRKK